MCTDVCECVPVHERLCVCCVHAYFACLRFTCLAWQQIFAFLDSFDHVQGWPEPYIYYIYITYMVYLRY